MQSHKQLYPHNPPHSYGDCFRTALGCLLDLPPEQVPHFYDGVGADDDATEANKSIHYWLHSHGYTLVTVAYEAPLDQVLYSMGHNNPTLYYLISGTSITGNNHCCVALGGEIIWDPAPEGKGLIGPRSNGQIIIEVLASSRQSSGWSSTGDIKPSTG